MLFLNLRDMIVLFHKITNIFWKLLPDDLFIIIKYYYRLRRIPNLKNPTSFTEKMQWLKLYNRKPIMTQMVDKYAAKQLVASIVGEQYIIPTLGVWDNPYEIDFEKLPNQFVLKCTHNSGGLIICRDKSSLDIKTSLKKLQNSLKGDYFYCNREWPYKNVKKRIIAEQFMEEKGKNDLIDYKFFCFNGVPKYCQVIRDRNTKETIDFYDMNWNHQEFVGLNPKVRNGVTPVAKPKQLDEMICICEKLATVSPFTRVDLYSINNKVYFGEITFYPATGMGVFTPSEWNYKLGNMIDLTLV